MKNEYLSTLGAVLALGSSYAVAADGPVVTVSDVSAFPAGPDVVGVSTLTRYRTGIEARFSTTGLSAAGAYSWWWVVFNNPEFCVDGCGLDDLPPPTGSGDPRVEPSLLWGTGFVSNSDGSAIAAANLDLGKAPGEVLFGPGLTRVQKADVHIVLRSHGPAVAGEVADQVSRFHGGCTPEELAAMTCPNQNVQSAAHPGEPQGDQ